MKKKQMTRSFRKRIPSLIAICIVGVMLVISIHRNRMLYQRNLYNENDHISADSSENALVRDVKHLKPSSSSSSKHEPLHPSGNSLQHESLEELQNRPVSIDVITSPKIVAYENKLNKKWDALLKEKKFQTTMPNTDFVFHNKLPKSGSTTMNNLLLTLSKQNNFHFFKLMSGQFQVEDTDILVDYIQKERSPDKPYFLLKHHTYFDFTQFGEKQPTFINVMREPMTWLTSKYYFARYGWERLPGCRQGDCERLSEERKKMELDECVRRQMRECTENRDYLKYFCGVHPECMNVTTYRQKRAATERAKYNILNNFYIVGILEQFEDTLKVFERLMPSFYNGAPDAYYSDMVQSAKNQTKTSYKKELDSVSKSLLTNGALHHEIELYNFAVKMFNLRMKQLNIKPVIKEE